MRHIVRLLTMLALLPACTDDDGTGPLDTPGFGIVRGTVVIIHGHGFHPARIVVPAGAIVTFRNTDNILHNVTFFSPAVASIPDFAFGTRTTLFPVLPGTFHFHCTLHPGFTGTVFVVH